MASLSEAGKLSSDTGNPPDLFVGRMSKTTPCRPSSVYTFVQAPHRTTADRHRGHHFSGQACPLSRYPHVFDIEPFHHSECRVLCNGFLCRHDGHPLLPPFLRNVPNVLRAACLIGDAGPVHAFARRSTSAGFMHIRVCFQMVGTICDHGTIGVSI